MDRYPVMTASPLARVRGACQKRRCLRQITATRVS